MAGALTAGVLTFSATAALAPPAGASMVGNAALCLNANPFIGGCAGAGGTTSGEVNTTPSSAYLTFAATSGLTSSDTITVAAPNGGQFQTTGLYDVAIGTVECTPSSVTFSNSNTEVTIGVRSQCAASAGATAEVVLTSALTLPPAASSCAQWLVSTSKDTQGSTTNCITVTSVPGAPTSPQATAGERRLTLNWTAPSNTGGVSLTGYDVYCSASGPPSTSGAPTATVGASSTSVTLLGLTNGVTYQCAVTAVNSLGQSSASPTVSGTPHPTAPPPPRAVHGRNGTREISVTWVRPALDGGKPITSYNVYCSTTNPPSTSGTPSATVPATTSPLIAKITHLPVGQTYYCVVESVNAIGASVPSTVVVAHSATAPGAPTAPVVTAIGPTDVVLAWTAPTRDGGEPVQAYFVYCSTTNPPPTTSADACGGTDAPSTSAAALGLQPGTTYYLDVIAVNAIGPSKPSAVISATTTP
jgi:predicted phage tail protein